MLDKEKEEQLIDFLQAKEILVNIVKGGYHVHTRKYVLEDSEIRGIIALGEIRRIEIDYPLKTLWITITES